MLEEIKNLHNQVQRLLERSPYNGAAISTISALLEAFKQPRCNQLMLKPPPNGTDNNNPADNLLAIKAKENGMAGVTIPRVDKSVNTDTVDWQSDTIAGENNGTRITLSEDLSKPEVIAKEQCSRQKSTDKVTQPSCSSAEDNRCEVDDVSRYTSTSNVNFDELDLKCMCSEDEEDCANYTESGYSCSQVLDQPEDLPVYGPNLIKQCSDLHLDCRTQGNRGNGTGGTGYRKTYESCDNLYKNKVDNYSYYVKFHKQPPKLDSELITQKLLKVSNLTDASPVTDEKPATAPVTASTTVSTQQQFVLPPVPPRQKPVAERKALLDRNTQAIESPPLPKRSRIPMNEKQQTKLPTGVGKRQIDDNESIENSNASTLTVSVSHGTTGTDVSVPGVSVGGIVTISDDIMGGKNENNSRSIAAGNSMMTKDETNGNNSGGKVEPMSEETVDTGTGSGDEDNKTATTGSKLSKRKKSPEKRLVLDLNDKSKYTGEVSV